MRALYILPLLCCIALWASTFQFVISAGLETPRGVFAILLDRGSVGIGSSKDRFKRLNPFLETQRYEQFPASQIPPTFEEAMKGGFNAGIHQSIPWVTVIAIPFWLVATALFFPTYRLMRPRER